MAGKGIENVRELSKVYDVRRLTEEDVDRSSEIWSMKFWSYSSAVSFFLMILASAGEKYSPTFSPNSRHAAT